jgi:uncharacterized protein
MTPEIAYECALFLASSPKSRAFHEAILWLLNWAAERGDHGASYALGNWYLHGTGVSKNYKKAVRYLSRAAELANPEAQYDLAVAFELGHGVRKDENTAFHWYLQAAKHGDVDGMTEVARCFSYGIGTERNEQQSLHWARKAAKKGSGEAAYFLGLWYQADTRQNSRLARKWFATAASLGHKAAVRKLKPLDRESRSPTLE